MAGELWRSIAQVAKEVTPGTFVTATRKMYMMNPVFDPSREFQDRAFATGSRDNVRAVTSGPLMVGGNMVMTASADEMTELCLGTIVGGVTPTTVLTTGKQWVFRPGASLPDSQSWEWDDGARAWRVSGVRFQSLQLAGSVAGEHNVTVVPFAQNMVQGASASLTDRVPVIHQGWESKIYVDAFGATPGTTPIAAFGINWDFTFMNNLERKFYMDNVNQTGGIIVGQMGVNGTFTMEAANAQALTEFNNWNSLTKRLLRFEFGNNTVIAGGTAKYTIQVDIPTAWVNITFAGNDRGTRVYQGSFRYVYDSTNAFGFSLTLTNARTTAY